MDTERKAINKVGYLVDCQIVSGREPSIPVIAAYHAEDIEFQSSFQRDVDILTAELTSE